MACDISPAAVATAAAAPAAADAFSSDGGLHQQQGSLNPQPVDEAPHISFKLKSKVEMDLTCASSESDFMPVPKETRCSLRLNKGSAPPPLEKSNTCHLRKKKYAVKPTVNLNGPVGKSKRACKKEEKSDNENARSETYTCNPSRLNSIIAVLSPDQKGFVADARFGHLLSMQACNIPRGMTMWLIKSIINCSAGTLEIGGKSIPIKPLVEKVIGAPSGPIPVELSRDVDLSLKNKFTVKGKGQPLHIAIPQMLNGKYKG